MFYHPCLSRLASGIHPLIFLYECLRVLSFQNMCWIFSDFYIPTCVGKMFLFVVFIFPRKCIPMHFYSCPIPWLKTLGWIFWKSSSPKMVCWRKLWFALSKFSQKIWRCLGTLAYLYFVWYVIFLNVMALQFCKWYLSNSVVLSLLPLLCIVIWHWNYISTNSYLNERWLFIVRFKVRSLPTMIDLNKKVLAQFIYKVT